MIVNLIYISLLKACKNTFPCPNRDLRAQYLRALEVERKKNNNNLPAASNANSAQDKDNNTWLLDFRRSLHSQLSQNVKHKQGHLYRYLFSLACLFYFLPWLSLAEPRSCNSVFCVFVVFCRVMSLTKASRGDKTLR